MNKMNKPKYLDNNDPWLFAEEIPDIDFQFSQLFLSAIVSDLAKAAGINKNKAIAIYHGFNIKYYFGEKDSDDFAKHLLKKLIKNPAWGNKINKNIRIYSDKLKKLSDKLSTKNLNKLDNQKLAKLYQDLDSLHSTLYSWGWLPNAIDMFHGNMTDYLKSLLRKKTSEEEVNRLLLVLSTSGEKSVFNLEHESFLKLVALKQTGIKKEKLDNATKTHQNKYFYFKHLWLGKEGVYDFNYYDNEINKFLKSGESAEAQLKKENKALSDVLKERTRIIKKLKLSVKEKEIFDVYAEFAVTKAYRRDAQLYWAYMMDFMFEELSKRLKINIDKTRFMFPWEIYKSLLDNKVSKELNNELNKRIKYCVYYTEAGFDKLYYDKEAKKLEERIIHQKTENIDELFGQPACLGKACGEVRIINSIADIKKMKKENILVAITTNPDIVPAMKLASAIVTEQGGITSHAAIVSREMNIPCVIGTKIATKVFKDGDLVEVDANLGIVKLI